jgi:hypothetical protein
VTTYVQPLLDNDNDRVPDRSDNCPDVANPTQSDVDSDGIGDACDTGDYDGDGLPDYLDTQPAVYQTPLDDDTAFVRQVYLDFLNREPEPAGLTFWVEQLIAGNVTRAALVEQYLLSPEFGERIAPVVRLYFAYFRRIPDYDGLMYWVNDLAQGGSLLGISNAFATSAEFIDTYGSLDNAAFATLVYQNVLGRDPEAGGLTYWTDQLNGGLSRGQMMIGFSDSAENQQLMAHKVYVTMVYMGLLRRAPDAGGFAYWVDSMNQGSSGQGLIDGFLTSAEYAGRFAP